MSPNYHETYYLGRTFRFGSLAQGTSPDGGDVNGFKIMAKDSQRGVLDLQVGPTAVVERIGSPQYQRDVNPARNRVAQYRNLAIWLTKNPSSDWSAVLPKHIPVEVVNGVTFIRGDETWFALHPINMAPFAVDEERTARVQGFMAQRRDRGWEENPETGERQRYDRMVDVYRERWTEHQGLAGSGQGAGAFSGFAIEVGEAPDFADYEAFKAAVLASSKLEIQDLAAGRVSFSGSQGSSVAMAWGDALADFQVWRNGELHDWAEHGRYAYREVGKAEDGLIFQRWGEAGGSLHVNAGGRSFVGSVDREGNYSFENR